MFPRLLTLRLKYNTIYYEDKKNAYKARKKQDFPPIYELVKKAFQTAEVSDGDEQDYVNDLRAGENYIPELALNVNGSIKIT